MERRGGGEGKLRRKGWGGCLLAAQAHLEHHLCLLLRATNAWKGAKREKTALWLKGKNEARVEKERHQVRDFLRGKVRKL